MTRDITKPCAVYEGCCGRGWLWDPTDDGSGRQVYCDCKAGLDLKTADGVERAIKAGALS